MDHDPVVHEEPRDATEPSTSLGIGCGTALGIALLAGGAAFGLLTWLDRLGEEVGALSFLDDDVSVGTLVAWTVFVLTFVALLRTPAKKSD